MGAAIGSILTGGKDGGGISKAKQDWSGGSGPFKAQYFTDPSLPLHTIYAPKAVVPGKKLPLLVWVRHPSFPPPIKDFSLFQGKMGIEYLHISAWSISNEEY